MMMPNLGESAKVNIWTQVKLFQEKFFVVREGSGVVSRSALLKGGYGTRRGGLG